MSEIIDYFFVIVILLVFSISTFTGFLILDKFKAATNETAVVNQTILNRGENTLRIFDLNFAFVFIGIAIGLFITAFLVNTHPIFLPFNIIAYIILVFVSAIFSNTAVTIAETSAFITTANEFPNMIFIWRNLPFFITILGAVNMIIMFAKISNRRGGV